MAPKRPARLARAAGLLPLRQPPDRYGGYWPAPVNWALGSESWPARRPATIRVSSFWSATPRNGGKANKTHAEQHDRGRFGHRGREFCDHDLAVTALKIGSQDLVRASVKGTAAAARRGPVATSTTAKAAASTPTWISRAASAATKSTVPADDAGEAAAAASSKIWEGTAAPSGAARGTKRTNAITTSGEEATSSTTTAEPPERTAASAAVTALPAVTGAAPTATCAAAALAGATSATSVASASAAATSDDQRHVTGTNNEGATAPTTALPAVTGAAPAAADLKQPNQLFNRAIALCRNAG
jgi:hypothetical protein